MDDDSKADLSKGRITSGRCLYFDKKRDRYAYWGTSIRNYLKSAGLITSPKGGDAMVTYDSLFLMLQFGMILLAMLTFIDNRGNKRGK